MTRHPVLSLALLLSLGACRTSSPASTQSEPTVNATAQGSSSDDAATPPSAPDADATDASASASDDAASAPAADAQAGPSPMERRLREMAASDEAFSAGISSTRGLVVVRYLEAPPSGRGRETRTNERVCPAQLTRRVAELRGLLVRALARAPDPQDMQCEGNECRISGMEYEESRVFTFETGDGGAMTLSAMRFVSEAAMPQRWIEAADAYHRSNYERLQRTPCPAR